MNSCGWIRADRALFDSSFTWAGGWVLQVERFKGELLRGPLQASLGGVNNQGQQRPPAVHLKGELLRGPAWAVGMAYSRSHHCLQAWPQAPGGVSQGWRFEGELLRGVVFFKLTHGRLV
jgi:hypothetical protein